MGEAHETQILTSGAGPAGLLLAVELLRRAIDGVTVAAVRPDRYVGLSRYLELLTG